MSDASHAAPRSASLPLCLLLIEDNPADARLIELMLEENGGTAFHFECVDRLAAGLDRVAAGGVDVVLLDLTLPDSFGFETFRRFHAAAPRVPVIVLSGMMDERGALEAVHGGAQDYLIKGQVTGPLLVRAARYAIERQHQAEQLAAYAAELSRKNALLEADLRMAREVQQAFLPACYPVFPPGAPPERSRLQFQHRYLPAALVGGDFFTVTALGPASAAVLVCDVVGHGLRAALVTAILRGLVEQARALAGEPGAFLAWLNGHFRSLLAGHAEALLTTAFYARVDVEAGELRFANAGHPSPLRLSAPVGEVEALEAMDRRHGPALGLFADATFPEGVCSFGPGERLLLFTDGIFEVEGAGGQEFGRGRFAEAVRRRAMMPTGPLLDGVLQEARQFAVSRDFADDVCLLMVESTGASPYGS